MIDLTNNPSLDEEQIEKFQKDGYYAFHNRIFSTFTVNALNHRLELVLRGEYDTGVKPDKTPKLVKAPMILPPTTATMINNANNCSNSGQDSRTTITPRINHDHDKKNAPLGYSGNKRNKVFQIINIHKSDTLFHELVTCPLLGKLVAKFMKWEHGARLAQDQIWAK